MKFRENRHEQKKIPIVQMQIILTPVGMKSGLNF